MSETFVRVESNKAVLNTDLDAYQAAKMRMQKSNLVERLNKRVTLLEKCLADLQSRIEKMEQR